MCPADFEPVEAQENEFELPEIWGIDVRSLRVDKEAFYRLHPYKQGVIPDWDRPCTYKVQEGDDLSWHPERDYEELIKNLDKEKEKDMKSANIPKDGTYEWQVLGMRIGYTQAGIPRVETQARIVQYGSTEYLKMVYYDQNFNTEKGLGYVKQMLKGMDLDCLVGVDIDSFTAADIERVLPAVNAEAKKWPYKARLETAKYGSTCYPNLYDWSPIYEDEASAS